MKSEKSTKVKCQTNVDFLNEKECKFIFKEVGRWLAIQTNNSRAKNN
jgi:hypothetical protein